MGIYFHNLHIQVSYEQYKKYITKVQGIEVDADDFDLEKEH